MIPRVFPSEREAFRHINSKKGDPTIVGDPYSNKLTKFLPTNYPVYYLQETHTNDDLKKSDRVIFAKYVQKHLSGIIDTYSFIKYIESVIHDKEFKQSNKFKGFREPNIDIKVTSSYSELQEGDCYMVLFFSLQRKIKRESIFTKKRVLEWYYHDDCLLDSNKYIQIFEKGLHDFPFEQIETLVYFEPYIPNEWYDYFYLFIYGDFLKKITDKDLSLSIPYLQYKSPRDTENPYKFTMLPTEDEAEEIVNVDIIDFIANSSIELIDEIVKSGEIGNTSETQIKITSEFNKAYNELEKTIDDESEIRKLDYYYYTRPPPPITPNSRYPPLAILSSRSSQKGNLAVAPLRKEESKLPIYPPLEEESKLTISPPREEEIKFTENKLLDLIKDQSLKELFDLDINKDLKRSVDSKQNNDDPLNLPLQATEKPSKLNAKKKHMRVRKTKK